MSKLIEKDIDELKVGDIMVNPVVDDRNKVINVEKSRHGNIVTFENLDSTPTQTWKVGSLSDVEQIFKVEA